MPQCVTKQTATRIIPVINLFPTAAVCYLLSKGDDETDNASVDDRRSRPTR